MSSRLKPNVICVRSLVPNEKNSAAFAIWSASRHARGISIIVPYRHSISTPVCFRTSSWTRSKIFFVATNSDTSQVTGTFYAQHGTLNVTGNAGQDVLGSQYISYDMKVNGGGAFNVNWDPNLVGRTRIIRLVE